MLDTDTQAIWEEANAMLLKNVLDSQKAHLLQLSLRAQALKAHEAGRSDDGAKLLLAADDLASRFLPITEVKLAVVPAA